jgi:hypothetical protein
MSGIDKYDWNRRIIIKQNQTQQGTNQSSGRSVGSRGIDKGILAGGLTGGGIGKNAINTDQAGNIQTSTHMNLQHSILPLVSDATLFIQTFNSPNFTTDVRIYGVGGSGTAVLLNRPDGTQMLCHPAGSGTGWDLGSNFGSASAVYAQVYFDVFFDGAGNGRYRCNFQGSPFNSLQLASGFGDNRYPIASTPSKTNTGLMTGTAGTYSIVLSGPAF